MKISRIIAFAATVSFTASYIYAQTPVQCPLITGVSHLSVYSSDSTKSESFYAHDLGGIRRADPEDPAGVRYYFNPVQFVEVLPLPPGYASINRLDHVAFNTADAEKLRRYLAAHGVAVPAHVENGNDGSQWLNVSDPEGNKVQFVQPPAAPLPVTVNPVSVHIIHVGYMVHDPNAEDKFFRELLGFRPYWHGGLSENVTDWISQQVPDGTDWMEYMVVHSPVAKGIPPDLPQTSLGTMNHFSLGVFNMENTVNLLTSGGRLTARHTPAQIGADGKWQLNIWDSENTRAELMEFQPVVKPCCSEFTAGSPSK